MLRHLFHQHAHIERAESAAAVFRRHAHAPQAGGLGFARDRPELALGNLGRIGIETVFDRDDLVADDALDLLAQRGQLFRQHEAVIAVLHLTLASSAMCSDARYLLVEPALQPFEPNPVQALQIVGAPGAFQRGIDFADVADRTIDLFNRLRTRRAALRAA